MSQGKYDWSTFTDGAGAMDIYGNTVRKSLIGDSYNAATQFKAVALTDMFPLNSNQAMALDGGSTGGGDNANQRYAYKGRIIGENSPHSFLPNPCDPADSLVNDEAVYRVIAMHTTFIATVANGGDSVTRGDIIYVELDKSDYSYNLEYGRHVSLSSVENPVATEGTACANLVGLVGEWGGPPPPTPSGGAGMDSTGGGAYASSACKDATPAGTDWAPRCLWGVVAREGKSKTWTDVTPLGGGLIGVAHFVGTGLYRLFNAMGDTVTQKYFSKTVAEMEAFAKVRSNCVGKTPKNKNCKPQHDCCYVHDWWREGMMNFVKGPESHEVQWKAWKGGIGTKAEKYAKALGWTTARQFAIAAGVGNSLGGDGFKELASKNGNDAERTLKAYITQGGHESSHRRRRAEAVDKYFPCDPTAAPKIDLSAFPERFEEVPEATPVSDDQFTASNRADKNSELGAGKWCWIDSDKNCCKPDDAHKDAEGYYTWYINGPPESYKKTKG